MSKIIVLFMHVRFVRKLSYHCEFAAHLRTLYNKNKKKTSGGNQIKL